MGKSIPGLLTWSIGPLHCTDHSFFMSISGNLLMTPHSKVFLSLVGTTVSSDLFHYALCTYAVTIHNLPLSLCFNLFT